MIDGTRDAPPIYQRGYMCARFTVVLQGTLRVVSGAESFECERGPWSVLGAPSLLDSDYVTEFTAVATGPVRLLHIDCAAYQKARGRSPQPSPTLSQTTPRSVRAGARRGAHARARARQAQATQWTDTSHRFLLCI